MLLTNKEFIYMITDNKLSDSLCTECKEAFFVQAVSQRSRLLLQKRKGFTLDEKQVLRIGNYALRYLLERYHSLIMRLVKAFCIRNFDLYKSLDLKQEAILAFLNAATTFDPDKGSKLSSWIYIQIRSRLQKVTRQALCNVLARAKIKNIQVSHIKLELSLNQVSFEEINGLLGKLTKKQRQVVSLQLRGLGWTEIALKLDSTADAVRMLWNRAVQQLRSLLATKQHHFEYYVQLAT
jgi:RNA polymerase sigma factor (sigma-70 family)